MAVTITPMRYEGEWLMKVRDETELRIRYTIPDEHVEPLREALTDIDTDGD